MRLIDARYNEHRNKLKKMTIKSTIAGTTLAIGLTTKEVFDVFSIMSAITGSNAIKSLIDYYSEGKMPAAIVNDPYFIPWQVTKFAK